MVTFSKTFVERLVSSQHLLFKGWLIETCCLNVSSLISSEEQHIQMNTSSNITAHDHTNECRKNTLLNSVLWLKSIKYSLNETDLSKGSLAKYW